MTARETRAFLKDIKTWLENTDSFLDLVYMAEEWVEAGHPDIDPPSAEKVQLIQLDTSTLMNDPYFAKWDENTESIEVRCYPPNKELCITIGNASDEYGHPEGEDWDEKGDDRCLFLTKDTAIFLAHEILRLAGKS
jgi:hypothetical protein